MQECGDDKLWRCQGRDPCCYSQTPKNTPPRLQLLSACFFFSLSLSPLLYLCLIHPSCPLLCFKLSLNFKLCLSPLEFVYLHLCFPQTLTLHPSVCFNLFPKDHFPFISPSTFFFPSLNKFLGSVSDHRLARCIRFFWPR